MSSRLEYRRQSTILGVRRALSSVRVLCADWNNSIHELKAIEAEKNYIEPQAISTIEVRPLKIGKLQPLDCVCLFVAGMRDGVGPLLTVFLIKHTQLSPVELSFVLAAPSCANVLSQVPIGRLYDKFQDQRLLVATGAILMAMSAWGISIIPGLAWLLVAQLCAGLGCCFLSVGLPALSLSSVQTNGFGMRLARNEIFSKIGNFASIGLTGFVAEKFSLSWIFYIVYLLALLVSLSCFFIKTNIYNVQSHNVKETQLVEPIDESFIRKILNKPELLQLIALCCLYQFANASMFLIFEQFYVRQQKNGGAGIISTALVLTQLVIMGASICIVSSKRFSNARLVLTFGFLLIALRGCIFAVFPGLFSLAIGQVLDGCIAAIIIIVPLRTLAAMEVKEFNTLSGLLGTCVSLGAMLSVIFAGYLIATFGYTWAFCTFAFIALAGMIITRQFLPKQAS